MKVDEPSGEEEEKKEEANFQQVKDLLTSCTVKTEEGEAKKLRAEDIFTNLIAKMMDMDARVIEANFKAFMEAWFDSRCFEQSSWKFVVKRTVIDLENYTSDLPDLPKWLCSGLICPLLRRGVIQIADLQWYKEEDKDELFDVTGQFKVAALLIQDARQEDQKTEEQVKQAWAVHGPAFAALREILSDEEKSELRDSFLAENVTEGNRNLVLTVLGLASD